jgi:hypothetical protein
LLHANRSLWQCGILVFADATYEQIVTLAVFV